MWRAASGSSRTSAAPSSSFILVANDDQWRSSRSSPSRPSRPVRASRLSTASRPPPRAPPPGGGLVGYQRGGAPAGLARLGDGVERVEKYGRGSRSRFHRKEVGI